MYFNIITSIIKTLGHLHYNSLTLHVVFWHSKEVSWRCSFKHKAPKPFHQSKKLEFIKLKKTTKSCVTVSAEIVIFNWSFTVVTVTLSEIADILTSLNGSIRSLCSLIVLVTCIFPLCFFTRDRDSRGQTGKKDVNELICEETGPISHFSPGWFSASDLCDTQIIYNTS